jgi:hypothetical protein
MATHSEQLPPQRVGSSTAASSTALAITPPESVSSETDKLGWTFAKQLKVSTSVPLVTTAMTKN